MNDDSQNRREQGPLLSRQQLDVTQVLQSRDTPQYPLSQWYLGSLYALRDINNPDRISQAAQSLRELIEKLPRVVQESDLQVNPIDFIGMRRNLYTRFLGDKKRYQEGWQGNAIDVQLDKTLKGFDHYLERNQQPTRKEQIEKAVANFDPLVH